VDKVYFNKDSIEYVDASLLKYDETATVGIISAGSVRYH
jgi:hypothetical protein